MESYNIKEYYSVKVKDGNLKDISNIEYYKDINSIDLDMMYYLYKIYEIRNISVLNKGIIGAYILKWLHEDKIKMTTKIKSYVLFKKKFKCIDYSKFVLFDNNVEEDLYHLLFTDNEEKVVLFKDMCSNLKSKSSALVGWFNTVSNRAKEKLIEDNMVEKVTEDRRDTTSYKLKKVVFFYTTEKTNELLEKCRGIEKYIIDFSKLNEKDSMDEKQLYKFLMFAELIGVDKQVKKSLSDVYANIPNYLEYNSVSDELFDSMKDLFGNNFSGANRSASN